MFISLSPLLALLAFSAQSAELPTQQSRSSLYSFTIYNGCDKHFAPVFEPALPGVKEWPVIPAGGSKTVHFRSDTYRGSFYAPIHGSKKNGTLHTTRAEMDVESGNYDISV